MRFKVGDLVKYKEKIPVLANTSSGVLFGGTTVHVIIVDSTSLDNGVITEDNEDGTYSVKFDQYRVFWIEECDLEFASKLSKVLA